MLERSTYWRTLRVTAWVLRFVSNCKARRNKLKKTAGPLVTEEITTARNCEKLLGKASPESRRSMSTIAGMEVGQR